MDNYYKYMIEQNNKNLAWNQYYYGIFSDVINKNNYKNVAEIGIGYGFHAENILINTNINKLYLVDPMQQYDNDGFSTDVVSNGGFENLVIKIKEQLKKYENKYTWFRKKSLDITQNEIPDNSLDAIFIDGDHSYEAVKNDLSFWWKKLKIDSNTPGYYSVLMGDDIWMPEVKCAVEDFAKNNNLEINYLTNKNGKHPDYQIYQFKKYN